MAIVLSHSMVANSMPASAPPPVTHKPPPSLR